MSVSFVLFRDNYYRDNYLPSPEQNPCPENNYHDIVFCDKELAPKEICDGRPDPRTAAARCAALLFALFDDDRDQPPLQADAGFARRDLSAISRAQHALGAGRTDDLGHRRTPGARAQHHHAVDEAPGGRALRVTPAQSRRRTAGPGPS